MPDTADRGVRAARVVAALGGRLLAVAIVLVLLTPSCLYGVALQSRLGAEAARTAEALAASLSREARREPRLWRYRAPKLVRAFARDAGVPVVLAEVATCGGEALVSWRGEGAGGPLIWRPIAGAGAVGEPAIFGWVGVRTSASPGHRRLGALALASVFVALGLGLWGRRGPLVTLRAVADEQSALLTDLVQARAELGEVNASLERRVQQVVAENERLTERVVHVGEAERRRIALDLHDDVGQQLTALRLAVDAAVQAHPDAALAPLRQRCDVTMEHLRRAVHDLRPLALQGRDLGAGLVELADHVERTSGLPVSVGVRGDPLGASAAATALYRIAQEALHNAVRHASADELAVRLDVGVEQVVLEVVDDGCGLDLQATGGGLAGMRERSRFLRGQLDLTTAADGGTRVVVRVPRARFGEPDA